MILGAVAHVTTIFGSGRQTVLATSLRIRIGSSDGPDNGDELDDVIRRSRSLFLAMKDWEFLEVPGRAGFRSGWPFRLRSGRAANAHK